MMLMIRDSGGGVKEHISKLVMASTDSRRIISAASQCSNRTREQNRDESNQKYNKYSFITMDTGGNVSEFIVKVVEINWPH